MSLCPLDYRYGRPEMKNVFGKKRYTQRLLDAEAALARAHAQLGNIPQEAADTITEKANVDIVDWREVERVEREDTKHDIMALVKVLGCHCGDAEGHIHLGATSNDIIDTATALQIRDGLDIIERDLDSLKEAFKERAKEHRDTIMVGRTHAQHGIPITFGLKLAVYLNEINRHIARIREGKKRYVAGKMSGAVGTGASFGENAEKIQQLVMEDLGIGYEEASGQIVGRDRHIELMCLMANISTTLQRFATEIRNLQRPEIMEAAEAFEIEKQVGSSTMAHKKNPITAENICGLARTLRGFVVPSFDNNILWHERDLTNSSSERITLPHMFVLLDDILVKSETLVRNLEVFPENMKRNLELGKGLIMGEAVMIHLSGKGMSRQEAHERIRKASMKARAQDRWLKEVLMEDEKIMAVLTEDELDEVMDPERYIGRSREIVDEVYERV